MSYWPGSPTPAQTDEFDALVDRLGDDAVKVVLELPREARYDDVVYAFDALSPAAAEAALDKLRRFGRW